MLPRKSFKVDRFSARHHAARLLVNSSIRSSRRHSLRGSLNASSLPLNVKKEQKDADAPKEQTSFAGSFQSPIVSIVVGPNARLFAAHEEILLASPYFANVLRSPFFQTGTPKRIELPDELPEVISVVLEFLYKGDYYPKIVYNAKDGFLELENQDKGLAESPEGDPHVLWHPDVEGMILKDTAIYCAAVRFSLPGLCSLSLRKQALVSKIPCSTAVLSARFAYSHTPDTDSSLRGQLLSLIIRNRAVFKSNETMRQEIEIGGRLSWDLFVAMANHVDDILDIANRAPTV